MEAWTLAQCVQPARWCVACRRQTREASGHGFSMLVQLTGRLETNFSGATCLSPAVAGEISACVVEGGRSDQERAFTRRAWDA